MNNLIYLAELVTKISIFTVGVFNSEEEAKRQLLIVSGETQHVDGGVIYEVQVDKPYRSLQDHRIVYSFEKE